MDKLVALDQRTSDCGLCGLAFKRADAGVKTAFGWGNAGAKYVLVTGVPAYGLEKETEEQRILKKIWNANGFNKEEWFVTHAIMCPELYSKVTFDHIDACRERLLETINTINPQLIVTSSSIAVYAMFGYDTLRAMQNLIGGNTNASLCDQAKIGIGNVFYINSVTHDRIPTANVVDIADYIEGREEFKDKNPDTVSEEAIRLMDSWTYIYNWIQSASRFKAVDSGN